MEHDVASLSGPFHNPCIVGIEYPIAATLLWFKLDYIAVSVPWPRGSLLDAIHHTILILIHDGANFSVCGEGGALAA